MPRGWVKSSVVALDAIALSLNKLNIAPLEFTKVIVIVLPDPASSDTNNDFITVVVAEGTVYNVVRSVVVKSTFLFLKLLAILKQVRYIRMMRNGKQKAFLNKILEETLG